jgi:hypothetical protein
MRTIAVLSLWAALSGSGEDPVRSYFAQHRDVRPLDAKDVAGCPEAPKTGLQFSPSIRADLTGDKREDAAFVVVSKTTPPQFGVVGFMKATTGRTSSGTPQRAASVAWVSTPAMGNIPLRWRLLAGGDEGL